MQEFSTKELVEATKEFLQLNRQIRSAGYNQFLGIKREKAKEKVEKQIKLYEAQRNQKQLKLK